MRDLVLLFGLFACLQAYQIRYGRNEICYFLGFDPDSHRNVSQLISSKGYPVEDYYVQTLDGFLLSVQHIPHGKRKFYGSENKEVVFLQHGLLSSSADWVMNSENESLGFILADAGYDVWLGNIRGNTYSRRHIKYTPEMAAFWNYSFDQMAQYDLPAMIDFVLAKTGQQQLTYIGHSQGTTAAFALLSENPIFNKKLKRMIALAPVATVGHIKSAIHYLAPLSHDFELLAKLFGVKDFLPSNVIMKYLSALVCDTPLKIICEEIIFLVCGTDMAQLNATRLGVYVAHSPAGSSVKSIIHFAQLVNSKKFEKFDYGSDGNMREYHQPTPPEYHLENISTPVFLIWSRNDLLADPVDVGILQKKLKSVKSSTCVDDPLFNHLDFVWGVDAADYVYKYVLSILKKKY